MHRRTQWTAGLLAALLMGSTALAADHLDGPAASADPAADITDLFAWMSTDGTRANLVLNVHPLADTSSKFSDAVQYVFHTTSRAAFGDAPTHPLDIVCTFSADQKISCWAGDEYVEGDASSTAGLSSGKIKVFAGLRNDPFYFNLDGFKATAATVISAKSSLTFDAAGCPALDAPTSNLLVSTLGSDPHGGVAKDFFKGLNVLSIVISIDKTVLTQGGSLVSVWASTHTKP